MQKYLILLLMPLLANAEEQVKPAASPPQVAAPEPDSVDISDLEEEYWRPNPDELEVVQNRKYEKKGRVELALQYGFYQGKDFVDSKAMGFSTTYNITNRWFIEASYLKIRNSQHELLASLQRQYGLTPDYNTEKQQISLSAGWTPIYGKFSAMGQKISHFETYIAPGIGLTETNENHLTGHLTIGEKFYITENLIFRLEWKMSRFTDHVTTTQGSTAAKNGGPGFVENNITTHAIIFGLGWMF